MILDNLNNLRAYSVLNPLFDAAADFIRDNNLAEMEPGKIIIDGERLYCSIMEIEGKKPEDAKMEAHKKYIDIQIVLKGNETMGWAAIEDCKQEAGAYNTEKDLIFYTDKPTANIDVKAGQCVLFFPEDGHAPGMGNGSIKKAVIKVLVS